MGVGTSLADTNLIKNLFTPAQKRPDVHAHRTRKKNTQFIIATITRRANSPPLTTATKHYCYNNPNQCTDRYTLVTYLSPLYTWWYQVVITGLAQCFFLLPLC